MFDKKTKTVGAVKITSNDPTAKITFGIGNIDFSDPNAIAEMQAQQKLLKEGKNPPATLSVTSSRPVDVVTVPSLVNNAPGTVVIVHATELEAHQSTPALQATAEIKESDPNSIKIVDKGAFLEAQVPLKDSQPAVIVIEKNDKSKNIKITLGSIMNFYTGITIEYNGKKHYKTIESRDNNYVLSVTPEFSFKSNKEIAAEQKAESSQVTKPQPTNNVSFSSSNLGSFASGFSTSSFEAPRQMMSTSSKLPTKNQIQEKINALLGLNCTFWDCSLGLSISMPKGTIREVLDVCVFLLKEKGIIVTMKPESTYCSAELNIQKETAETLYAKLSTSPQNTVSLNNSVS